MIVLNALVSILHHKYQHGGVRMDLAYIAPRIIASAEPTEESLVPTYRTKVADLERFLCDRHGEHWHVWNLQEDEELNYDPTKFGEHTTAGIAVSRYPIRDHCPMPFHELIGLVTEIQAYLHQDPRNVALVHCKCGKGRTGMVISTYLMATRGDTAEEANREFTRKRIRYSVVKGVSINSQLRYLGYAHEFYSSGQNPAYLRRGLIRIVAVSVRYSQFKNLMFSVVPLDSLQSSSTVPQSWNMVSRRDHLTVMCPADTLAVFPADLLCQFTGFDKSGSTGPVSFAFNADFEARNPKHSSTRLPLAVDAGTPPPYGAQVLGIVSADPQIHSFRCDWEMVDGRYGTPWLGPRLFDSIEIFWRDEAGSRV